jgi:hypothetical protein
MVFDRWIERDYLSAGKSFQSRPKATDFENAEGMEIMQFCMAYAY